jgi:3-amino-5-hydroxybenzoate synthase
VAEPLTSPNSALGAPISDPPADDRTPAAHGGRPYRTRPFPPWPQPTPALREALLDTFDSGHWWRSGWQRGRIDDLEDHFTRALAVAGTVAVGTGTAALEVIFQALGLGPGDEVLVPATTFVSTATAVASVGATPVPADVHAGTLCLDVQAARERVTPATRAVVPVHLAGNAVDMDAVRALAEEFGLFVVEDVAQALGTEWKGRPLGAFGDLAATSFQAGKLLPGGEGGAVFVREDARLLRRIHQLSHCGTAPGAEWYEHEVAGSNHRMTEFQAALVLAHTRQAPALAVRRRDSAELLAAEITRADLGTPMRPTPGITHREVSTFWLWLPDRVPQDVDGRQVAGMLNAEGVPAAVMYPAWHRTRALAAFGSPGDCPVAERAARRCVWFHHRMLLGPRADLADIAGALDKVVGYLARG